MATQETTFERHYSVEELRELWQMSDDFIRRLFVHEPGVVIFIGTVLVGECIERFGFQSQWR